MKQKLFDNSIEFINNKIQLYLQQYGKCKVSGLVFSNTNEIHCHHIIPKRISNDDSISNLVLVTETIHKLIHSTDNNIIHKYLQELKLEKTQLKELNKLRKQLKLKTI